MNGEVKIGKFKMALDKGTFDAISLSPIDKKESMDKYIGMGF